MRYNVAYDRALHLSGKSSNRMLKHLERHGMAPIYCNSASHPLRLIDTWSYSNGAAILGCPRDPCPNCPVA
jgi:hypothetical protein